MLKYRNIKKTCLSKHLHASKLEAAYCNRLLAMKQKGEIKHYAVQIKFDVGAGIKHIVDFVVWVKGDLLSSSREKWEGVEVHETKGYFTAVARLKKKLFEEKYPNIPYKVIYKIQRRTRCKKKEIGVYR